MYMVRNFAWVVPKQQKLLSIAFSLFTSPACPKLRQGKFMVMDICSIKLLIFYYHGITACKVKRNYSLSVLIELSHLIYKLHRYSSQFDVFILKTLIRLNHNVWLTWVKFWECLKTKTLSMKWLLWTKNMKWEKYYNYYKF